MKYTLILDQTDYERAIALARGKCQRDLLLGEYSWFYDRLSPSGQQYREDLLAGMDQATIPFTFVYWHRELYQAIGGTGEFLMIQIDDEHPLDQDRQNHGDKVAFGSVRFLASQTGCLYKRVGHCQDGSWNVINVANPTIPINLKF